MGTVESKPWTCTTGFLSNWSPLAVPPKGVCYVWFATWCADLRNIQLLSKCNQQGTLKCWHKSTIQLHNISPINIIFNYKVMRQCFTKLAVQSSIKCYLNFPSENVLDLNIMLHSDRPDRFDEDSILHWDRMFFILITIKTLSKWHCCWDETAWTHTADW
jgi:hypothetical protein